MDGTSMMASLLLVLLVVAQQVTLSACIEGVVMPENDDLDFYVMPSSDEITFFNHGFITPGILNLENLSFETKEELDQFGNSLTEEFVVSIPPFRVFWVCSLNLMLVHILHLLCSYETSLDITTVGYSRIPCGAHM